MYQPDYLTLAGQPPSGSQLPGAQPFQQDPTAPPPLPQPGWEQFQPGLATSAGLSQFIHEQQLLANTRRPNYFSRMAMQQRRPGLPPSSQPSVVQQVPIGAPAQPSVGLYPVGKAPFQAGMQIHAPGRPPGLQQPFGVRGFR